MRHTFRADTAGTSVANGKAHATAAFNLQAFLSESFYGGDSPKREVIT